MITADLGIIVPIGGKQLKAYSFESLPGESFHLPVVAAALIVSDVHCPTPVKVPDQKVRAGSSQANHQLWTRPSYWPNPESTLASSGNKELSR